MTIHSPAHRDANPTFADAVFLDVGLLGSVKTDADIALEDFLVVVRAFGINAQTVRKFIRHAYCDYQTALNLASANILSGSNAIALS